MKSFRCDNCGNLVFFQNDVCVKCSLPLGFLPDLLELSSLKPLPENRFQALTPRAGERAYRHCANGPQFRVCNWMVAEEDSNAFCVACRLNEVIPALTDLKNRERWRKLELAKRRCLYTFLKLGLPLESNDASNQPPMRFRFLQDLSHSQVKTGHQNGVITLNIAEADEDERERRRLMLQETYRTLVGHIRHESGHFYWDRLISYSPHLPRFRELFGDESINYDLALQTYYQQGPPPGWQNRTVTAYASSHPWEDWAESWAHYLHIVDVVETAANFGVSVNPDNAPSQSAQTAVPVLFSEPMEFEQLMASLGPLTCALNSINRGMGLPDVYPFIIPPAVTEKLRFIHEVIHAGPPKSPVTPDENR